MANERAVLTRGLFQREGCSKERAVLKRVLF